MNDLLTGVRSVFTGMGMIVRDPRVRRLAIAPFLVNIVLVLVGLPLLIWIGGAYGADLIPGVSGWPAPLRALVQVVAALVVAVVGIVLLLVLARIVASPLMTRLSEAVEQSHLGDDYAPRVTTLGDDLRDAGRGVAFALGRLLLFLLLYPPILLLGLIPVIGPILAPVLTLLYGALVLSLDFSEPVLERHSPGLRSGLRHVRQRPLVYLGFGAIAVAMALVPFANLAVLPVCVAGATIAYLESRNPGTTRA